MRRTTDNKIFNEKFELINDALRFISEFTIFVIFKRDLALLLDMISHPFYLLN